MRCTSLPRVGGSDIKQGVKVYLLPKNAIFGD
jgi:hypothetical protein